MPHTADTLHVAGWLATPRAPTAAEVNELCLPEKPDDESPRPDDDKKYGLGLTELRGKDWKIYAPDAGNGDWRCNHWAFLAPPAFTDLDETGKPYPMNHWVANKMWYSFSDLKEACTFPPSPLHPIPHRPSPIVQRPPCTLHISSAYYQVLFGFSEDLPAFSQSCPALSLGFPAVAHRLFEWNRGLS